ncbi:MAG: hypothetical protein KJ064_16840 [Anaerolineae bacterium]|nr:hypothetical protein [Anaerolineae bacterium]
MLILGGYGNTGRLIADYLSPENVSPPFRLMRQIRLASNGRAAIETGIDYFDVQYSTAKLRVLEGLREDIEKAGCPPP